MAVATLPADIVAEIISWFPAPTRWSAQSLQQGTIDQNATNLHSCALVSSSWLDPARSRLFRTVCIFEPNKADQMERPIRLMRAIDASATAGRPLAALIREIEWTGIPTTYEDVEQYFPGDLLFRVMQLTRKYNWTHHWHLSEELSLDKQNLTFLIDHAQVSDLADTIRQVTWETDRTLAPADDISPALDGFVKLANRLHRVESLALKATWDSGRFPSLIARTNIVHSVTSLSLSYVDFVSPASFCSFLAGFLQLRILQIDRGVAIYVPINLQWVDTIHNINIPSTLRVIHASAHKDPQVLAEWLAQQTNHMVEKLVMEYWNPGRHQKLLASCSIRLQTLDIRLFKAPEDLSACILLVDVTLRSETLDKITDTINYIKSRNLRALRINLFIFPNYYKPEHNKWDMLSTALCQEHFRVLFILSVTISGDAQYNSTILQAYARNELSILAQTYKGFQFHGPQMEF